MWAFEHAGIVADVVCLAKAIANGLPLSAIVSSRALQESWGRGAHGSTFGGNPVACAAGLAVIRTIREEGLVANAAARGAELTAGLRRIMAVVLPPLPVVADESQSEEQLKHRLIEKLRRMIYTRGFFRVRSLKIEAVPLPGEICVPYWVCFRGSSDQVHLAVLDAVRRRPEGAKVRRLIEEWLRSERAQRPTS